MALALVGPTASGKSSLAMRVAAAIGGVELVAIDAMTVYRDLDIGTAKPTPAERAEVPHHCLDLVDPSTSVSLHDYRVAHRLALDAIAAVGHRAVAVGGTGLYVRAIIDDLDMPGAWPEIRQELQAEVDSGDPAVSTRLYAELLTVDPTAAARIEPGNSRRVVRALEVCRGSGRPFSSFGPGLESYPPAPVRQIGLRWGRDDLLARIEQRIHDQIAAGWLDEVERVWPRCGPTARQVIGYGELAEHLAGRCTLDEAVGAIVARTRRFAVRQERWFRRDPRIEWFDGDAPEAALASVLEQWVTST